MYASHWECQTQRHNESKEFDCGFEERSCTLGGQCKNLSASVLRISWTSIPLKVGRTKSIHVGTRKMVNYAWSERSQGKL